jgi:hypothetical protein
MTSVMSSVTDRDRARAIWYLLPGRVQALLNPEFQAGFRSWQFDQPCVNPYAIETDSWKWAAFQMGHAQALENHGGR